MTAQLGSGFQGRLVERCSLIPLLIATFLSSTYNICCAEEVTSANGSPREISVDDIEGQAGGDIPLGIRLAEQLAISPGFLIIEGIPESLGLSAGFRTTRGWMLSPRQLANLRLIVPERFEGAFNINITYVSDNSSERSHSSASISISSAQLTSVEINAFSASTSTKELKTSKIAAVSHRRAPPVENEKAKLTRARALLELGDVSSARLIYEHLAANGSSLGALAMAKTYDQKILLSLGVVGLQPNPKAARKWYERAAELGSGPALTRLQAWPVE